MNEIRYCYTNSYGNEIECKLKPKGDGKVGYHIDEQTVSLWARTGDYERYETVVVPLSRLVYFVEDIVKDK